jgi:predicted ribosome quality control (RQC) complex YloA/Tae2 family protein
VNGEEPGSRRFHEYTVGGRWKVLAGRTDEDNDYLSLRLARPNDRWFHVRGMPGSHVVLRCPGGDEPDRDTLRTVAAIAAYHSKAREAGVVAVSCVRASNVSKPRGAKPGTVQIRKETVIRVRPGLGPAVVRESTGS